MGLIDEVKKICDRLAPHGWRGLMAKHGLDIAATNLEEELLKVLPDIKRSVEGFTDFAAEGARGIEPGKPAQSLLFHAFASPNVLKGADGKDLTAFPTLVEIEAVENCVYGIQAPTIQQLFAQSQGLKMAVVVFATEYRPASETVHKRHADMCFSRTGVARAGNAEKLYDESRRGFLPFDDDNDFAFRVLPAKYSAYIGLQMEGGDGTLFGPTRINPEDRSRKFWVPLHKLFDGEECIKGLDLKVSLNAYHVNEKIKRIHLQFQKLHDYPDKIDEKILERSPFKLTTGIAEFSTNTEYGTGLLVPTVHTNLIEAAEFEGKPLSFAVPNIRGNEDIVNLGFPSTLSITRDPNTGDRHAPEYVHVRLQQIDDATTRDLNDDKNMLDIIKNADPLKLRARHFIDFTGDGWIEASCPQVKNSIADLVPAYSLITAPDFFPNVDQGEVKDWALSPSIRPLIDPEWANEKLAPLSDDRFPANLELKNLSNGNPPFDYDDDTVTAIVCLPQQDRILRPFVLEATRTVRHAYLPDAASGLFQPGWDVSIDNGHFAAYGLGSPFPEDSKLCAALSSYWPAVAPDASRTFPPQWPTVSPLTDEEIGQSGNLPWDGVSGPKIINIQNEPKIEYSDFDYTDYVSNMLENKFTLKGTGQIDIGKYKSRILALAVAYKALPNPLHVPDVHKKTTWPVTSFKEISQNDPELRGAQTQSGAVLEGDIFRIEMCNVGNRRRTPENFKKIIVDIKQRITFFAGSGSLKMVLFKDENGEWRRLSTP